MSREHHRNNSKYTQTDCCSIGDVVLIHKERIPRAMYKVGVIEQFKKSHDNLNRVALVRYTNNDKVTKIWRPICKLYPIEVGNNGKTNENVTVTFVDEQTFNRIYRNILYLRLPFSGGGCRVININYCYIY